MVAPASSPAVREFVAPAPPRRFLIVDDEVEAAEALAFLLERQGHATATVHDGAAALALCASERPDVVLLDLTLPGIDGYEVCRRIRALPRGRRVALFAVTGWCDEGDRDRTRAAGFDAHLAKPLDLAALERAILAHDRRG